MKTALKNESNIAQHLKQTLELYGYTCKSVAVSKRGETINITLKEVKEK